MENNNCCGQLKLLLEDKKTSIGYEDKFREYYIEMKQSNSYQIINYCPWCGKKLPTSLRDEWFDILEEDYNIEDVIKEENKIPKEFKSGFWWKNPRSR